MTGMYWYLILWYILFIIINVDHHFSCLTSVYLLLGSDYKVFCPFSNYIVSHLFTDLKTWYIPDMSLCQLYISNIFSHYVVWIFALLMICFDFLNFNMVQITHTFFFLKYFLSWRDIFLLLVKNVFLL